MTFYKTDMHIVVNVEDTVEHRVVMVTSLRRALAYCMANNGASDRRFVVRGSGFPRDYRLGDANVLQATKCDGSGESSGDRVRLPGRD